MISLKILTTFVALLMISHNCIFTVAQEGPGPDEPAPSLEGSGAEGPSDSPDGPPGPPPGSKHSDSSDSSDSLDNSGEGGQRLFFSGLFASQRERVSCDYATQAGSSCVSCNQRLVCTRLGGLLTTCRGFLRYCTDGRCSFRQSDACAAATTSTTTAATTTAAAETTTSAAATTTDAAATG